MSRTMVFVDGENLIFRYQNMVLSRRLLGAVVHEPDVFVWEPLPIWISGQLGMDIVRASYYTSMVGGDDEIERVTKKIRGETFWFEDPVSPTLQARVFKRAKKENKTRIVDVRISIDALHHAHENHADQFVLFTGDADFLPLVNAIMREGKQVTVFAFSDGLGPTLEAAPDRMLHLDRFYFEPPA